MNLDALQTPATSELRARAGGEGQREARPRKAKAAQQAQLQAAFPRALSDAVDPAPGAAASPRGRTSASSRSRPPCRRRCQRLRLVSRSTSPSTAATATIQRFVHALRTQAGSSHGRVHASGRLFAVETVGITPAPDGPAAAERDDRARRLRLQRRRPADRVATTSAPTPPPPRQKGPPNELRHQVVGPDEVRPGSPRRPGRGSPARRAGRAARRDPRLRAAAPDAPVRLHRRLARHGRGHGGRPADRPRDRPGRRREPDGRRRGRHVRADDRLGRRRGDAARTPPRRPARPRRSRPRRAVSKPRVLAFRHRPAKDPFVPLLGETVVAPARRHGDRAPATGRRRDRSRRRPQPRRCRGDAGRDRHGHAVDARRRPPETPAPVEPGRRRPTTPATTPETTAVDRHASRRRSPSVEPAVGQARRRRRLRERQEAGRRRRPVLPGRRHLVPAPRRDAEDDEDRRRRRRLRRRQARDHDPARTSRSRW